MRQSIQPTYDRTKTGDRFTVETRLDSDRLDKRAIPDPFVNTTVHIGWRDLLRGLLRRRLSVTVIVGGDREIVEDVTELDADYTGRHDSTRQKEWKAQLEQSLHDFAERLP